MRAQLSSLSSRHAVEPDAKPSDDASGWSPTYNSFVSRYLAGRDLGTLILEFLRVFWLDAGEISGTSQDYLLPFKHIHF